MHGAPFLSDGYCQKSHGVHLVRVSETKSNSSDLKIHKIIKVTFKLVPERVRQTAKCNVDSNLLHAICDKSLP